ncbi:GNAT family N-acetyltransferase [Erythrobacter sp. HA6-11]
MFHVTQRLLLRPAWPEDAEAIFAGIGEREVVCNLARAPWPYTLKDAREFLSRPAPDSLPRFVITIPGEDGSELVGMVGLNCQDDGEEDVVELGYWIARSHWGQGIATEAVRGVLEVARTLGIKRIEAGHFTDNPASGRVMRKVGFRPTGERRAQFSLARGGEVSSLRYVIDLAGNDVGDDSDFVPQAA